MDADVVADLCKEAEARGSGRAHPVMRARRSSSSTSVESGRLRRWRLSGRSAEPVMLGGGAMLTRTAEIVNRGRTGANAGAGGGVLDRAQQEREGLDAGTA